MNIWRETYAFREKDKGEGRKTEPGRQSKNVRAEYFSRNYIFLRVEDDLCKFNATICVITMCFY